MPSRDPQRTQFILALIIIAVIAAIAVGLWYNARSSKADWANGPVTPGVYVPPTTDQAPTAPQRPATPAAPQQPPAPSVQMLLGNPSDATPDPGNRNNYLMVKPYFALSYNADNGTPNWVSWRLCESDMGTAPRARVFSPDDTLPAGFYHVLHKDYANTGFDRGHMCDHADRAATMESSYATFVLTNIVPQAPNNNRKCWERLESYCRDLVHQQHDRLYITAGPWGRGGAGEKGPADTIAGGRVVVPASTWKVIVVTPDTGSDDLANINAGDRVIAVDVPNDNSTGEEWSGFRCTPAAIEQKTGYHFFMALPPDVRVALEQKLDTQRIVQSAPTRGGG